MCMFGQNYVVLIKNCLNYALIGGTLEAYGSCRVCLSIRLSVCLSFKSCFSTMLEHLSFETFCASKTLIFLKKILNRF